MRTVLGWALSFLLLFLILLFLGARGEPGGCASCGTTGLARGDQEQVLIEMAKQHILSKLHLSERPNITQPVPRATLINALRKLHAGRLRKDGTLELEKPASRLRERGYEMVSFADTDFSNSSKSGLAFQFSKEADANFQVLKSTLWLYFRSSETIKKKVTARLFLASTGSSNRTFISQKKFEVAQGSWHTFVITQGVQAFFDRGDKRLQLEVECQGCQNLAVLGSRSEPSRQPFLVAQVRLREDGHTIRKRSLDCDANGSICCKKDFYIKFRDIDWQDWIIAPEGYHMNYCMGQCPQHLAGSPGIASSFHAAVFNQLKANGIQPAVSSCCVPTQRRPLSMLYFDPTQNIVKTDIPDMIVEACGCT
ncbi:inhibin beta B chain [Polypterus senegalus]